MKQKKKWIYAILSTIAVFIVITIGIVAFGAQKNNDTLHNRLKLSSVKGKIKEDFTSDIDIKIGGKQKKDIKIENIEKNSFFVRVLVFPEIKIPSSHGDVLLPANIGQEIIVTLGTDWEDGGDGYYYYKGKLAAGATTQSLFTEIELADTLGEDYTEADFSIQVKSETVTAANHYYRKVWWNKAVDTAPTEAKWLVIDDVLKALAG